MTTFEFTPPGGDPLSDQLAADRHGYAMLVLAVFAVASLVVAVATGQRAWAWATAGFGIAALVLFLVVDLPDVNKIGDIEAPGGFGLASAEAVPQPGFWLEAAAAIVLGLASIAFATQSAEQAPGTAEAVRVAPDSRSEEGTERSRPGGPEAVGIPGPFGSRRTRRRADCGSAVRGRLGGRSEPVAARRPHRPSRQAATQRTGEAGAAGSRTQEAGRLASRERPGQGRRRRRGRKAVSRRGRRATGAPAPPVTSGSGRRLCWPAPCGRCRPCACRRRPAGRRRP